MTKHTAPTLGQPDPRALLAELPDDALVTVRDVAMMLGVCSETVARLARRHQFPPPIRLGGAHRWRLGTVRQHLRGQARAGAC